MTVLCCWHMKRHGQLIYQCPRKAVVTLVGEPYCAAHYPVNRERYKRNAEIKARASSSFEAS
jgi:hypothetical protein